MNSIIETKNLSKAFGSKAQKVIAVRDISLMVKEGEIFGFLGPNGAGKTTTMRMLTTLIKPTAGSAHIAGYDLMTQEEQVRAHIGYVSQSGGLERSATARENLVLQGKIYGMSSHEAHVRAQELIIAFNLSDFADRIVETYSGGQRRRTDIALGIVHKPKIIFLDEPTVGLDPQSRAHVWEEIKKLRMQGTSVFFTTHYLDEADALCDRVAIVDHGTIVALDTPSALKHEIASDVIVLGFDHSQTDSDKLITLFKSKENVREVIKDEQGVRLLVYHGERLLPHVLRSCDGAGITLSTISLHRPTLDDVFLEKTGRSFKQDNQEKAS